MIIRLSGDNSPSSSRRGSHNAFAPSLTSGRGDSESSPDEELGFSDLKILLKIPGEFADNLQRNLGTTVVEGLSHSTRKQRCLSCYGAHNDEDDCCNTCESVKEAWGKSDWQIPVNYTFEQCAAHLYEEHPPAPIEVGEFHLMNYQIDNLYRAQRGHDLRA